MPTCNQRVAAGTAFRAKIGLSIPTLNSSLVYLVIRLDLPTPESPISYETEEVHAAGYTHKADLLVARLKSSPSSLDPIEKVGNSKDCEN